MVSLDMQKHVSPGMFVKPFCLLLAFVLGLLAVVATTHSTGAIALKSNSVAVARGNPQQNNQSFVGTSNSGNIAHLSGENQGNSGNQGLNRGFSQDNSLNGGNAVSSQRKNIQSQDNHQEFIQGNGSGGGGSSTLIGANQGNSGNQGTNQGFNQDNANNTGNQVNNQGNVIGTQINNQGTQVNNNGSVIKQQTNYINLLPALRINLLQGQSQLSLGTGG